MVLFTEILEKDQTKDILMAKEIIDRCMKDIKTKVYSFVYALSLLKPIPVEEDISVCTDGEKLFFHAKNILQMCKKKQLGKLEEEIFHILMHGMLGHFEEREAEETELSWAVMDIQVKKCKRALYPECNRWGEDAWKAQGAEKITADCVGKELYYRGKENKKIKRLVSRLGKMAKSDDHRIWSFSNKQKRREDGENGENGEEQQKGVLADTKHRLEMQQKWAEARKMFMRNTGGNSKESQILQMTILQENGGRKRGSGSGNFQNEVEASQNVGNSYSQIMREILQICETVKEEDELDKALYQYGLEMYGDVPLVEPEEMSEKKQMHTFVLAVDTSGSCTEREVQFLREIINIFDELKNVAEVEHICYLECDEEIQCEKNYYELDSFVNWGSCHVFSGGGGTSFLPVFEKADELKAKGEKIDALFYLTDAQGEFPEESPDYPVYLLLDTEEEWDEYLYIPSWAKTIKLDFATKSTEW